MTREKWHQRLVWLVIAALVTAVITAIFTPIIDDVKAGVSLLLSTSGASNTSAIPQLKPNYSGTLKSNEGLRFTIYAQDEYGNIKATMYFNSNTSPDYYCTGTVTSFKSIFLDCQDATQAEGYTAKINASIYPDGHIEGTVLYSGGMFDYFSCS